MKQFLDPVFLVVYCILIIKISASVITWSLLQLQALERYTNNSGTMQAKLCLNKLALT